MTASNFGKTWTPEMDDQLIQLLIEGKTIDQIANEMGRGTGSIISRMEYIAQNVVRFTQLKKTIVDAFKEQT